MERFLTLFQPLPADGVPDGALDAAPPLWLPPPVEPLPHGAYRVVLRAGPASRPVSCRVGVAWRDGAVTWRPLEWTPDGGVLNPLLPAFVGEVGLLDDASLVLTGSYRPPLGALGAAADAAGLRRVAETTARRFLDGVARRLATPAALR